MGFVSFWRNRLLSLATSVIIFLALFIISVFATTTMIANNVSTALKNKVDLTIYLKDSISEDQIVALEEIITARPEVTSIKFVSKTDALNIWRLRQAGNLDLQNVITEEDNPLPQSFEIKTINPEDIQSVASYFDNVEYASLIQEISYEQSKALIDRLIKITHLIKTVGWALSAIFILISVLIVYNTLRLTIYSRSDEIEIMNLVGASGFYIRGPFVFEGMTYGITGAILAAISFYFSYRFSMPYIRNYLSTSDISATLSINVWLIMATQLLIGLLMGAICSLLAMRRYLNINKKK
ncbi:MAG: cell division transport system permease protein [Candidatus Berkelbacteria bacterium Athens1014_28]|uniref:Cell division protein FtsX n=1 Tax=Candidatus Berkelbacteria bacterium Athens1014_28 TaxID=2017145 RepID=A0A554LJS6_9BACT|nr:MAG: cell division transport system permease protein [Candidatus Berkelbacteria bacterium Athens1014_28]